MMLLKLAYDRRSLHVGLIYGLPPLILNTLDNGDGLSVLDSLNVTREGHKL